MKFQEADLYVGLDVGRSSVEAVWVNEEGEKVDNLSFPNNHQGYERFIEELNRLQEEGYTLVLGAEGHSGNLSPLDQYLNDENFKFLSIHPLKVCRYKDILGQPKKTDNYDAYVVADFLRSKGDRLENTPQFDPVVQQAKKLSRTYKDLKEQTNRYVNQLNEVVGEYIPELLDDKFPNLTSKTILCLLHDYGSLSDLRRLEVGDLADFLDEKSQGYYGKDTAELLLDTICSIDRTPLAKEAYQLKIKTLADLLLTLDKHCKEIEKRISKLLEGWEDAQIILSLPGAGEKVVSKFLGEIETVDRFDSADSLGLYCGASPLPYSSGSYSTDRTTNRVNKRAKDAIMQMARCSAQHGEESRRYYEKKRREGKSYWHAIKCLARQLIRVIYAMLRDRTYYNPNENSNSEVQNEQKKEVAAAPA
ncbi:MAG: IS110 family transposase [Candidatus Bipolaricaulota bacterium]